MFLHFGNFLQKGAFLQKGSLSAEILSFCRNTLFLQKCSLSAEMLSFCRNDLFLQKEAISAEITERFYSFSTTATGCSLQGSQQLHTCLAWAHILVLMTTFCWHWVIYMWWEVKWRLKREKNWIFKDLEHLLHPQLHRGDCRQHDSERASI